MKQCECTVFTVKAKRSNIMQRVASEYATHTNTEQFTSNFETKDMADTPPQPEPLFGSG
jgi:hypothetical protein